MPVTTTQLSMLQAAALEVRNAFPDIDAGDPELLAMLMETKEFKKSKASPTLALSALHSVTPTVDIPINKNKQYAKAASGDGQHVHYHGPVIVLGGGNLPADISELFAKAFQQQGAGLNLPALPPPTEAQPTNPVQFSSANP